ncbi:hypothetical protein [Streptomyces sp. TRM68367]|uniref:hypothetical protein n=1 Tax=Streptomyces sp. TRM68367 TaxID=2758415 RepID=UPI00165A437F|nr:hypothetical protein [Streptomyces sp. TRM68367]MBC9729250.1 hypothetical protein [Streptomyces sp. TRM68367]
MLEGFEPTEDTGAVHHVIYEDGSVGRIEVTAGAVPELSRPGSFVSEERYQERVKALEEVQAARIAEVEAAELGRSRADFLALSLLGLAEETARRLSGYTGPDASMLDVGES